MNTEFDIDFKALNRMSQDLKQASKLITAHEARLLVDRYYQMQDGRIRSESQIRAVEKQNDLGQGATAIFEYLETNTNMLETQMRNSLTKYAEAHPLGVWAMSICGIAGVLAAGLLAHIQFEWDEWDAVKKERNPDIHHIRNAAGSIWSYAGLVGTPKKKEKGVLRDHNAKLKTLCYKIGESFVKVQGNDKDFYGKLFSEYKREYWRRNLAGDYREAALEAAATLRSDGTSTHLWNTGKVDPEWVREFRNKGVVDLTVIRDALAAYDGTEGALYASWIDEFNATGVVNRSWAKELFGTEKAFPVKPPTSDKGIPMLSPAHIHARARRKVVKLFLSHFFEVGYHMHFGTRAPAPYIFAIESHKDYIPPPNYTFPNS